MNSPARIPVHALKAGLSQYLKQLADGGSLIVTSHDRPVARLQGIASATTDALSALLVSGAVTWQGGKPAQLPALRLAEGGTSVSEMVLQDRVLQDRVLHDRVMQDRR